MNKLLFLLIITTALTACSEETRNEYRQNTPTSGKLKIFYDEGLHLQIRNLAYTFETQYHRAEMELYPTEEDKAVEALLNDSCEAIFISRFLNENERALFAARQYTPQPMHVATSGLALITSVNTPLNELSVDEIRTVLGADELLNDSAGRPIKLRALFDRNNSSVLHYAVDSILKGGKISANSNVLGSTVETIEYISNHPNTIGFIDFAWLSDVDDSLFKKFSSKFKFLGVSAGEGFRPVYPSQSSFKTGDYVFSRPIYYYKKRGEFSLAKGLASFILSQPGQLIFLKQGLLPARQSERVIEVKFEEFNTR